MVDTLTYFFYTLIVIATLIVLLSLNSIRRSILSLFGGSIELPEAAGVVFMVLFTYMIIKEGNREHEWHIYNELYIFFVAGAAMTGLGLNKVLNTVKDIKIGNSSSNDRTT
jgi:hypothetical protein